MGVSRFEPIRPDRVGAPPTALRLSAAMLASALAATSPASAEEYAKLIAKHNIRWHAPDASQPSFQSLGVLHGSIVGTTKSVEPDPWQDLEALQQDWDGSGAEAVSRDAMDHAKRFLRSLSYIETSFAPFAHPDGSVGLESQKPGSAAYLLVSPSDRFTYVLRIGDTVHRGDDVDSSTMREVLALLY